MAIRNTRNAYGSVAIALHWISAIGVVALYFLGERMEEAADRTAKVAAQDLHVSVAVLLFTFLAARLMWSASQPKPLSLERNRYLQFAAKAVHVLVLLMVATLLITGPLAIWSTGRPIEVFNLFAIPSPFSARLQGVHEATETIHGAATKLFWPLIVLHVGGALKHLIVNRDGTVQRMLWARVG